MSYWSIITPVEATNLVSNPSCELAATGYTAIGGSAARSTAYAKRGAASLAVTPTAALTDGVSYAVTLTAGAAHTMSVDVRGVLGIVYKVGLYDETAGVYLGSTTHTGTGDFVRVSVTATVGANTSCSLRVTKNSSNSTGVFYVDGLLCVALAYDVTYIDGDQDGCKWLGAEHASTSGRDGQSTAGGRIYDLDDFDVSLSDATGIGMPPNRHLTQEQAFLPGDHYRGRKVLARPFALTISAENTPAGLAAMHGLRKDLINVLKPDQVKNDSAIFLRYTGANADKPVLIACTYESGLELGTLDYTFEKIVLSFIAHDDPYFVEDGDASAQLTASLDLAASYIVAKIDGDWTAINGGANGAVNCFARGQDGSIYIGGNFTSLGGVAVNRIAKYNPVTEAVTAVANGFDSYVNCLAVAPDGSVYIGGNFVHNGTGAGTDYNYIAKYDPVANTFSALSTGMNAAVYAMAFDQDGTLFIGGNFTTAGGSAMKYVTTWNGSAFAACGAGMNNAVQAIAIGIDNAAYFGGAFTDVFGSTNTYKRVVKYAAGAYSTLGAGVSDNIVYALAVAENGLLYIGGSWTGTIGGVNVDYLAVWNGVTYTGLGSGVNGTVQHLSFLDNGNLFVTGTFTTAGGIALADRLAGWNGYSWYHIDANLPGTPNVNGMLADGDNLYIGFDTTGTAVTSAKATVTNNGTAAAYPKFVFKRAGGTTAIVEWIRNETTGATLYLNYSLLDGETLSVDLTPGSRWVKSSFFGNVWRALLRNSDFTELNLLPGANDISVFIYTTGSPTITSYALWKNRHWSADGPAV